MPHQWIEGNLPVSAKCTVCDKTCGSVLRLQDWRCLWCKAMVRVSLCRCCTSIQFQCRRIASPVWNISTFLAPTS